MLLNYGINYIEIKRYYNENDEIISASKVRKYMEGKKYMEISSLLTNETMEYLIKHKYMRCENE